MNSHCIPAVALRLLIAGLLCAGTLTAASAPSIDVSQLILDPAAKEFAAWQDPRLVSAGFFTEDLGEQIRNGLSHSAQFEARLGHAQPILAINKTDDDGVRHPLTLSIGDGGQVWRNFIVGFDDAGSLYLSLDKVLRQVEREAAEARSFSKASGATRLMVRVLSAVSFEGFLFDGERLVSTLEVQAPRSAPDMAAKSTPGIPPCCGPNMGFFTRPVTITAENNVSVTAYAHMGLSSPSCFEQAGRLECSSASLLHVEYPQGILFHDAEFFSSPVCAWSVDLMWPHTTFCNANTSAWLHRTSTNTSQACLDQNGNPTLQRHEWSNMVQVLDVPGRSGTITAISGCQRDGTWSVRRAN